MQPPRSFVQRIAPLTWLFAAINIAALVYGMVRGLPWNGSNQQSGAILIDLGARYTPRIDIHGEWWRFVSAMWLHANVLHLLSNLIVLLMIGSEVERFFGSVAFGFLYIGSGLSANIASYSISPVNQPAVGSSGALMGVIGALAAFDVLSVQTLGPLLRRQLSSILMLVAATLLLGLMNSNIDQAAHIGGLIAGLGLGWFLVPHLVIRGETISSRPRAAWRWWAASAWLMVWMLAAAGIHYQHLNDPTLRLHLEQLSSQRTSPLEVA